MGDNFSQIQNPQQIRQYSQSSTSTHKGSSKRHKAIQHSPKMKVKLTKISPIPLRNQCQDDDSSDDEYLNGCLLSAASNKTLQQSSKNIPSGPVSTLRQFETCCNIKQMQQIKVNWNSFIKMKNRNYEQQYEVIRKIGRGGFGVVSKVKSLYTDVVRAAKQIKKKQLKDEEHKKLLEEMAIMRSLDHPNIIKLYEVYDYQNEYVLLLELSSGGELYKRIKGKKLTQKTAKNYMRQIIRTLIYLHSQGIVHRDLKPQNMLFESEKSDMLKIIDFGIACRLQEGKKLTSRIGTPYFLAPEVIYKEYDEKCDIWSAGIIFYMMLTGIVPFKANNDRELLQCILKEQPKMSSSLWNKVSDDCKELLQLMLRKKPEGRPSAVEVLEHRWFQESGDNGSGGNDKGGKGEEKDMVLEGLVNGAAGGKESESKMPSAEKLTLNHKASTDSSSSKPSHRTETRRNSEIITQIRRFYFKNKLQAVVHTFIASQLLSTEDKALLIELFKELDKNNDGVISTIELQEALNKKKKISQERVETLMKIIDTNGSGEIEYTEFLVASLSNDNMMKADHFQKAFKYFDIDHSGTITYEEVVEFLGSYEEEEDEIQRLFAMVDSNGDGEISEEEFVALFIKKTDKFVENMVSRKTLEDSGGKEESKKRAHKISKDLRSLRNMEQIDVSDEVRKQEKQ